MSERIPYPFEVYNRPCSATYDVGTNPINGESTDDFVLVDLQPTLTIIQYPRSWHYSWCVRWAEQNGFPIPESFGGTPNGCLMFGPWEPWNGNILGIPRDNH